MKNTIISCTITLCSVLCAVGYFIACTCNTGQYSSPLSYLDVKDSIILIILLAIALVSIILLKRKN